jgi:hypothetical protein
VAQRELGWGWEKRLRWREKERDDGKGGWKGEGDKIFNKQIHELIACQVKAERASCFLLILLMFLFQKFI